METTFKGPKHHVVAMNKRDQEGLFLATEYDVLYSER